MRGPAAGILAKTMPPHPMRLSIRRVFACARALARGVPSFLRRILSTKFRPARVRVLERLCVSTLQHVRSSTKTRAVGNNVQHFPASQDKPASGSLRCVAANGIIDDVLGIPCNTLHSSRSFQSFGCWLTRYTRPMQRCGGAGWDDQCQGGG